MPPKAKEPSFEDAIQELEEITRQLERGSLSLTESIQAYEKGMQLGKLCKSMLQVAERKLEFIEKNKNGEIQKSSIQLEQVEEGSLQQSRLFQ